MPGKILRFINTFYPLYLLGNDPFCGYLLICTTQPDHVDPRIEITGGKQYFMFTRRKFLLFMP